MLVLLQVDLECDMAVEPDADASRTATDVCADAGGGSSSTALTKPLSRYRISGSVLVHPQWRMILNRRPANGIGAISQPADVAAAAQTGTDHQTPVVESGHHSAPECGQGGQQGGIVDPACAALLGEFQARADALAAAAAARSGFAPAERLARVVAAPLPTLTEARVWSDAVDK
jgi:hypothetical protein